MNGEPEEAVILKTSMNIMKDRCAVDIKKYGKTAKEMGHQFGLETASRLVSLDLDSLISELGTYWMSNKIGEMEWYDNKHTLLSMDHCSDCIGKSYSGRNKLCLFKEGFLEAVLSSKLDSRFYVTEVKCCTPDALWCIFEIKEHARSIILQKSG